jgi:hypothetical protein
MINVQVNQSRQSLLIGLTKYSNGITVLDPLQDVRIVDMVLNRVGNWVVKSVVVVLELL